MFASFVGAIIRIDLIRLRIKPRILFNNLY
jgi:hypothetical protein